MRDPPRLTAGVVGHVVLRARRAEAPTPPRVGGAASIASRFCACTAADALASEPMGLVYLAALVVGLGVLVAQVILGGKDAGHGGDDGHDHVADDAVAMFFTTRFWIFFALAFGLSGSLMHAFALASPFAVGFIAAAAGIASGLFAGYAFRAVRRATTTSTVGASEAVGQVGRILVACSKGKVGQVRVLLKGQSIDLLATTDEDEIGRGSSVLVEEIRGTVAHVSSRPPELE